MKVKPTNLERKKPIRMFYWALIVLFVSLTLFLGRNTILQVGLKKMETAKLQAQVDLLKAKNDSLRKENHELKTNPALIEKIARENLGYQKTDEKVYRFLAPPKEDKTSGKK